MPKGKFKAKLAAVARKPKHSSRRANALPPEIQRSVEELRLRFRQKFGRDPCPEDPLFFDPESNEPFPLPREALNEIWEQLATSLVEAGRITPEAAYAMKKTGLLVADTTAHLMTDAERNVWQAALDEYSTAVNCSRSDHSKFGER